ncbi:hypothetical protein EDB84DRAFT_1515031 [Lactarius hengduanensis]|nr:hypothetical protein EDB85DRAFT_2018960 [Lactarius pseudohatsudake]KAH9020510.1 hypothetical protein EDB84DRAFT_1515031 [Lactarius hengduanensis]
MVVCSGVACPRAAVAAAAAVVTWRATVMVTQRQERHGVGNDGSEGDDDGDVAAAAWQEWGQRDGNGGGGGTPSTKILPLCTNLLYSME